MKMGKAFIFFITVMHYFFLFFLFFAQLITIFSIILAIPLLFFFLLDNFCAFFFQIFYLKSHYYVQLCFQNEFRHNCLPHTYIFSFGKCFGKMFCNN